MSTFQETAEEFALGTFYNLPKTCSSNRQVRGTDLPKLRSCEQGLRWSLMRVLSFETS